MVRCPLNYLGMGGGQKRKGQESIEVKQSQVNGKREPFS